MVFRNIKNKYDLRRSDKSNFWNWDLYSVGRPYWVFGTWKNMPLVDCCQKLEQEPTVVNSTRWSFLSATRRTPELKIKTRRRCRVSSRAWERSRPKNVKIRTFLFLNPFTGYIWGRKENTICVTFPKVQILLKSFFKFWKKIWRKVLQTGSLTNRVTKQLPVW